MKVLSAFFRLIRWQNLVFIAVTQFLFFFFVFFSVSYEQVPSSTLYLFYLLVAASVLIAAAGYIINDYFDLHIDIINKPGKVIVDKILRRRWAIVWHLVLSGAGILISVYISWVTRNWLIAFGNMVCVILLWFYSTTFKKHLLIGNIIISALTAWVIFVIYIAIEVQFPRALVDFPGITAIDNRQLFKFTVLYACFAFIVSLIREVIKDLEDMEGDAKYNCNTMPIKWGVPVTKVFTAVWLVVAIGAMIIIQVYAWALGWRFSILYCICLIIAPLLYILQKLRTAAAPADYHKLSIIVKLVMLAGILSMIFFYFK